LHLYPAPAHQEQKTTFAAQIPVSCPLHQDTNQVRTMKLEDSVGEGGVVMLVSQWRKKVFEVQISGVNNIDG
jgi:hypothetical protein